MPRKKPTRDHQDSASADVDMEEQLKALREQLESAKLAVSEANGRCQEAEEQMATEMKRCEGQSSMRE